MKIITLNRKYTLGRQGFKYAFVFKNYATDRFKVERLVKEAEGYGWASNTSYGKGTVTRPRPYYVGFNKESTAVFVQLQM